MKPYYETSDGNIYQGNALDILKQFPDESVHCCVTSPPYWGLRDYGLEPVIWEPINNKKAFNFCNNKFFKRDHIWGNKLKGKKETKPSDAIHKEGFKDAFRSSSNYINHISNSYDSQGQFCQLCGAWRGCLGLEPTPELYVNHMVQIFREVKRVLKNDGTLWLNLGDTYGTGTRADRRPGNKIFGENTAKAQGIPRHGFEAKQLCGTPWRIALALQADGWWFRQDIIWHKPNPMPESVRDRCTKSHEYVFLLSKSQRYYYDFDAIKEERQGNTHDRGSKRTPPIESAGIGHKDWCKYMTKDNKLKTRNKRSVWTIATQENIIKGTLAKAINNFKDAHPEIDDGWFDDLIAYIIECKINKKTVWTRPTQPLPEDHFAAFPEKLIEPCILAGCPKDGTVLDPFIGACTTAIVAYKHSRKFIGIDLSETYLKDIGIPRIENERKQRKWC